MKLIQFESRHLRPKDLLTLLASVAENRFLSLLRITRVSSSSLASILYVRLIAISGSHGHMRYLLVTSFDVKSKSSCIEPARHAVLQLI